MWTFALATITMPVTLWSQPVPDENEWVVVIDAGHGGKDPGAVGAISKEKDINLAVALKAGKYISDNLRDVKVIYTRIDDTFPGLAERAEVANRHKADVFISIHSNAISDKRFTGAETYVLGQTMDDANLQVAMKENSVITFEKDYKTKYEGFDPNSAESYIIFSLMQNTYLKQSTEFATMIQNQFRDRVGRKDRGVRQAGFVVLWRTTMPSVLVELGFISNPDEEKYLNSSQGQDYLASAIFRAFRDYKQTIDSRSGIKRGNSVQQADVPDARAGGQGDTSGMPFEDVKGRD
ncbi:MAG: N-acetylmuramoyl-L-alanine amidase, partial [Bacteroidales bacterium]|nr:N-acetylmuramoyl-L-alanine amidase [Bacteroidales bacterium]